MMSVTLEIFGTLIVIISVCLFMGIFICCMRYIYDVTQNHTQNGTSETRDESPAVVWRRRNQFSNSLSIQTNSNNRSHSSSPLSREHNHEIQLKEILPQQESNL